MTKVELAVEVTRTGYSAMWENGGGRTNTGDAFIIAEPDGGKPSPLFVKTGGHLACGEHALIIVKKDMILVSCQRHHQDFKITVMAIESFYQNDKNQRIAVCEIINQFHTGEWDAYYDPWYQGCVEAAIAKSEDYHCRRPYWIKDK